MAFAVTVALVAAPATAIVNGSDAITNPGAVSLWTSSPYRNRCSGVLIHPRWAITAAHCQYSLFAPGAGTVEVRIGNSSMPDNTTGSGGYILRTVVSYTAHPGFDVNTLANDVMLLELDTPTGFKPAKIGSLPVSGVASPHGYGWVCDGPAGLPCSSWHQGPLQKFSAEKLPRTNCITAVDANHVCFEDSQGDYTMACLGDSGAGAFTKGLGTDWHLRFLVLGDGDDWSGASCLTKPDGTNGYGLGVEVEPYVNWMQEVIYDLPGSMQATTGNPPEHASVG